MAYLTGYGNRIEITIDSTNVDTSLTHFPVAILISNSSGKTASDLSCVFNTVGDSFYKIAVTKYDGVSQLYVEVVRWSYADFCGVLWVSHRDFEISASEDTTLFLYYDSGIQDNTSYVGVASSMPASKVWDSFFIGVYNMAEGVTGGALSIKDSTLTQHASPAGSMTQANEITIGCFPAIDTVATSNYIDYTGSPESTRFVTLESYHRPNNAPSSGYNSSIINHGYSYIGYSHTTAAYRGSAIAYINSSWRSAGTLSFTSDVLTYQCTVYDGIYLYAYKDGALALQSSNYMGTINSGLSNRTIAEEDTAIIFARISNIYRSDAFFKATNATITDDLLSYSSPESAYTMGGTVAIDGVLTSGVEVLLYNRDTHTIMDYTTSSGDGSFNLTTLYYGDHYMVALCPSSGTYNALVYDWLHPRDL